jgi:CheY-like chemotaxis protein
MAIVLIVDDEEMERTLGKAILEGAGHQVLFAENGKAALKICEEKDVEVLVTDLAMPGFGGLRLIKELRQAGFDLPIVALSGRAADQLDLADQYGADITLFKPADAEDLRRAIDKAMALHLSRDPSDLFGRNLGRP